MDESEKKCCICGEKLMENTAVILKKKSISSMIAKNKARKESDWVDWEGKDILMVHEQCKKKFTKQASHPPAKKIKYQKCSENVNVNDDSEGALKTSESVDDYIKKIPATCSTDSSTFVESSIHSNCKKSLVENEVSTL